MGMLMSFGTLGLAWSALLLAAPLLALVFGGLAYANHKGAKLIAGLSVPWKIAIGVAIVVTTVTSIALGHQPKPIPFDEFVRKQNESVSFDEFVRQSTQNYCRAIARVERLTYEQAMDALRLGCKL